MTGPGDRIPHTVKDILARHAAGQAGALTGSTRPLVENRLREAVLSASENVLPVLRDVVQYIWDELPEDAHGSPEKVRAWAWCKEVEAHPDAQQVVRVERDQANRLGHDTHTVGRYAVWHEPDGEGGQHEVAALVEGLGVLASERLAVLLADTLAAEARR